MFLKQEMNYKVENKMILQVMQFMKSRFSQDKVELVDQDNSREKASIDIDIEFNSKTVESNLHGTSSNLDQSISANELRKFPRFLLFLVERKLSALFLKKNRPANAFDIPSQLEKIDVVSPKET